MYSVPAEIINKTTKCRHQFSCLKTGRCGDNPMCKVEAVHSEHVLCVSNGDWPSCPYHLDFGGARFCVCPVRGAIHAQQAA